MAGDPVDGQGDEFRNEFAVMNCWSGMVECLAFGSPGVILAAADTNDRAHEACVEVLESMAASGEPETFHRVRACSS